MSYRIGDRVTLIVDRPGGNTKLSAGIEGTIVAFAELSWPEIGVDWDVCCSHHNCGGSARDDHGWYVTECQIELVQNVEDCMAPILTVEELCEFLDEEDVA